MSLSNFNQIYNMPYPFLLTYGCEVILPIGLEVLLHRRISYTAKKNNKLKETTIDLIKERRDKAAVISVAYRQKMAR